MDSKVKLFMVVSLILCFLVFLYLRRKRLQENFECAKIDNSLFCIKEIGKINRFRKDQDENYKTTIEDRDFYNYLDLESDEIIDPNKRFNFKITPVEEIDQFKNINNYNPYSENRLVSLKLIKESDEGKKMKCNFKYDFIKLDNHEIDQNKLISESKNRKDAKRIMTPGGILFDKYTDDVIIFDAYRLRRFSYRDMKVKYSTSSGDTGVVDYYPMLDAIPLEIKNQSDLYRQELVELIYAVNLVIQSRAQVFDQVIDYELSFNELKMTDAEIDEGLKEIRKKFLEPDYKDKDYKLIYKNKNNSEIDYNTKSLLARLKFLEDNLKLTEKIKKCLNMIEDKCQIKYQRDLPSFDMGPIEGKGVEGMQYDDDQPPTIIHSTYIDNRMEPWQNSWNNINSEGVFSPLVTDNSRRMKIFNKSNNVRFKNFKEETGLANLSGNIEGVKQFSVETDKPHIYNETTISPLAREGGSNDYLDKQLFEKSNKNLNFYLEEGFQNKKAFKVLNDKKQTKNKINYGYPSMELVKDNDKFNLRFSIGLYNIPDEIDSTGIGMEIVDIGDHQIILVPDTNNNRVQVFRKDKRETLYYGQFGNLPYTSSRSLPMYDNHTRYEQIHDTEQFNSLPGCKKTCDFDTNNKYQGTRDRDFMNRQCMAWGDYSGDDVKINKQQINNEYKKEGFKQKDFFQSIKNEIKKGKNFGNKCQSLDDGKPVCIIDDDGVSTLSKCFPDFYLKDDDEPRTDEVRNLESCNSWMTDYKSKFGPIDANLCLGDNESLPLTPKEIKEGKRPTKDCVFECDSRFSYRRANIHQRQIAYKNMGGEEVEVFRKRGHFYSLLDEYQRCREGIEYEKKNNKKAFEDSEFINPHFLGVDSQACVGKKSEQGDCKTRDTRNTSGIDNCSLGYRKYLLKIIAATNQGQKFGQLFHPKSIAYDDIDKKYYVVDSYHHSIQCFNLEDEKEVTESGEKIKFVCADKEYNDRHVFYYDENFKTGASLKYNATPMYSLGLRQNLLYEEKFENFSRVGEVSDDKSAYLKELDKNRREVANIPNKINDVNNMKNKMKEIRDVWRNEENDDRKFRMAKNIIGYSKDIEGIYKMVKDHVEKIPIIVYKEKDKKKHVEQLNNLINETNQIFVGEVQDAIKEKVKRDKLERLDKSELKDIPGTEGFGRTMPYSVGKDKYSYPDGTWSQDGYHNDGTLNSRGGFHMHPTNFFSRMIIEVDPKLAVVGVRLRGRNPNFGCWGQRPKIVNLKFKNDSGIIEEKNVPYETTGNNGHFARLGKGNWIKETKWENKPIKNVRQVIFTPRSWTERPTMRAELLVQTRTPPKKGKYYQNKRIDDEGNFIDERGNIRPDPNDITVFAIKTLAYEDKAEVIETTGTAEQSQADKKFSKEKGFSVITKDWGKKYSDSVIRLNRWVSGISPYGNHVFAGFNEKIDYEKIREQGDYFFNTIKGGGENSPGCGEFSYPSDIAISKNTCLGDKQIMFITDTGNNRVSLFKKYKIEGEERFRFYSFLGDEEENAVNRKFINPISVCVSEVSGNVFVLEANLYNNPINRELSDKGEHQRIKVFYCDKVKGNYFYSHTISVNNALDVNNEERLNNIYSSTNDSQGDNDIYPRITKIRIDDRGILALTDINNNKVHFLKETMSQDFKIKNIDDMALNKVTINVEYNPYKKFKSYEDRFLNPILNHDRLRFLFQRQRVCAFQNSDMIISSEYKTGNMPFTDHKKIFNVEDIIQELEYDNCWIMNTSTGFKYINEDIIIDNEGEKMRKETNLPNFEIKKKYNSENRLLEYEDWRGRSLEPNSSYLYKVFIYNYNFVKTTPEQINKVVQTYPVFLKEEDIIPKSVFTDKENYINLGISYGYLSKRYNPICFTIMRRIHNRTADICTKNINCLKKSKVQLFLPAQSKIIYQIKSRPKFGKLLVYDLEKGGEFDENIFEMERSVDYSENKYLIFYSCEGGNKEIGGIDLPDSKAIGRSNLVDSFTLGDKLESVHTQITYNVSINLTKTDQRVVLFKDNETVDEFMEYYQKSPQQKSSTDLNKLIKLSFARETENGSYAYPGMIEYCDKGINDGVIYEPIQMNQTYEYIILVSNPFKVNPAVNSFYYTTKPEKPYIHSVEYDRVAMEEKYSIVEDHDVAKVTWYYPKNRSLYWPLNFLVLRKDISKVPIAIEPLSYDVDFTFVAKPLPSDKLFRITKHSLKLINNSDPSSTGTFKRRYNLGKIIDWRIKFFGTPGIDILVNKIKYDWNEPYIELNNTKFLDITIKLRGQQQINNITCEETVVIDENSSAPSNEDIKKIKQFEQHKKKQEREENNKIKESVEEYRKSSGPNFIFRLDDDYQGFYSNRANAPKTGRRGSLYNYIKDMDEEKLLDIYDELSNEMKIYSGDVGLRMDGEGRTLRSGDKEMLIDKIRHFAFILRESRKTNDKVMGIDCNELSLDDIEIVTDNTKEIPQVKAIICKNLNQPRIVPSITPSSSGTAESNTNQSSNTIGTNNTNQSSNTNQSFSSDSCATVEQTGLNGTPNKVIENVTTLGECCQKCQLDEECEVAEFKENENKCEIFNSYNYDNEIPGRTHSTLLGKTQDIFNPPIEEVSAPAPASESIVIPPDKSDWEIIKVINSDKRTGNIPINLQYESETQENFQGEVTSAELTTSYTFRPSLAPDNEEMEKIMSEYSFNPTIVSLSSDPEGLSMSPATGDVEFSSHEILIPIPKGRRYAYKIAVYQTGFCMDSPEKKRYLGVDTNNSKLGLGEIYSDEIELGESIQQIVMNNKPPLVAEPVFKEPEVDRPVIKFFEPKEGDANSIVRVVGLKLDEIEYFCFRDVKVKILKKQERIIGNVKYQEYLFKPPSVKELNRKCWQSIEKYRALIWGYYHGYQIISSEGSDDKTKMFTYISTGQCKDD